MIRNFKKILALTVTSFSVSFAANQNTDYNLAIGLARTEGIVTTGNIDITRREVIAQQSERESPFNSRQSVDDAFITSLLEIGRATNTQRERVPCSTVLIGMTGSGKSLIWNILNEVPVISHEYKISDKQDPEYYYDTTRDDPNAQPMGNPNNANSTTHTSKMIEIQGDHGPLFLWDTPGFGHHDNQHNGEDSIKQRLLNAYSIRNIAQNSNAVRFIICTPHQYIKDRNQTAHDNLVNQISSMFGGNDVFDSCGLVITKSSIRDTFSRTDKANEILNNIMGTYIPHSPLTQRIAVDRINTIYQVRRANERPYPQLKSDLLHIIHQTPTLGFSNRVIHMPNDPQLLTVVQRISDRFTQRFNTLKDRMKLGFTQYIQQQRQTFQQNIPQFLILLRNILDTLQETSNDYLSQNGWVSHFSSLINQSLKDIYLQNEPENLRLIQEFVRDFQQPIFEDGEELRKKLSNMGKTAVNDIQCHIFQTDKAVAMQIVEEICNESILNINQNMRNHPTYNTFLKTIDKNKNTSDIINVLNEIISDQFQNIFLDYDTLTTQKNTLHSIFSKLENIRRILIESDYRPEIGSNIEMSLPHNRLLNILLENLPTYITTQHIQDEEVRTHQTFWMKNFHDEIRVYYRSYDQVTETHPTKNSRTYETNIQTSDKHMSYSKYRGYSDSDSGRASPSNWIH